MSNKTNDTFWEHQREIIGEEELAPGGHNYKDVPEGGEITDKEARFQEDFPEH